MNKSYPTDMTDSQWSAILVILRDKRKRKRSLRDKLIPMLKEKLPDIARQIAPQGKRVQSNAFIKFTKKDGECWVKLHAESTGENIKLDISAKSIDETKEFVCHTKDNFFEFDKLQEITEVICGLYQRIKLLSN